MFTTQVPFEDHNKSAFSEVQQIWKILICAVMIAIHVHNTKDYQFILQRLILQKVINMDRERQVK
jgi:hypothetical protein